MAESTPKTRGFNHLRRVAVTFSFLCIIIGIVGFGVALYAVVNTYGGDFATISVSVMLAGQGVLVFAGIIGIIGGAKSSSKMLKLSLGIILVCILLFTGVAVFTHLKLVNIKAKVTKAVDSFMHSYGTSLGQLHHGYGEKQTLTP